MKVLVVDDHALIRDALRGVLRDLLGPALALLEAGSGDAARAQWRAHEDIELVLLDLHLPDADGMELLEAMGRDRPGTAIVMLSGDVDQDRMREALARGAQGFIPKSEPRVVLAGALGLVLAGGVYVPPAAVPGLTRPLPTPEGPQATPCEPGAGAASPESLGLTERQLEVLSLMMEGKNNKLICRALDLAEPTVKNHVSAILRALGVGSRMEAVLAVSRMGWTLPRVDQR